MNAILFHLILLMVYNRLVALSWVCVPSSAVSSQPDYFAQVTPEGAAESIGKEELIVVATARSNQLAIDKDKCFIDLYMTRSYCPYAVALTFLSLARSLSLSFPLSLVSFFFFMMNLKEKYHNFFIPFQS